MDVIGNSTLKPCVVFIEKWIASNQIRENDDRENVCHIVNDERVRRNTELTSSNDPLNGDNESNVIGVNGKNSPADKGESMVQELINDTASAASLLLAIKESSKSDQRDDFVAPQNDVDREQGSVENSSKNISTSGNVDEREELNATASRSPSSNLFELGHALYEEMVVDTPPLDFSMSNDERGHERPIGVDTKNQENDLGSQNCNRAIMSGDGNGSDSPMNYFDHMQQNDARQNSEYAELCEDHVRGTFHQQPQSQSSQIEYADDDDSDRPMDYSIRGQYHASTDNRNDSTMEWSSFVSPPATLRTGFAQNEQRDDRFLKFPAQFHIDDERRATRKNLYFPVARIPDQSLEEVRTSSQYSDTCRTETVHEQFPVEIEHSSVATNVIGKSPPPIGAVDASSQTEIESRVANSLDEHFCRMFMENTNCNLNTFMQWCYSVAHLAFGTMSPIHTSKCGSTDCGESSRTHSENRSSQQLERHVSHHEISSDANGTLTENISVGCRKKKKGIPQRQSERILEITARKDKKSQNSNGTDVVVAPKKSKSDINQKFDVEHLSESYIRSPDESLLDVVPRNISSALLTAFSKSMESPPTPKRSSKYLKKRKEKKNSKIK